MVQVSGYIKRGAKFEHRSFFDPATAKPTICKITKVDRNAVHYNCDGTKLYASLDYFNKRVLGKWIEDIPLNKIESEIRKRFDTLTIGKDQNVGGWTVHPEPWSLI